MPSRARIPGQFLHHALATRCNKGMIVGEPARPPEPRTQSNVCKASSHQHAAAGAEVLDTLQISHPDDAWSAAWSTSPDEFAAGHRSIDLGLRKLWPEEKQPMR